MKIQPVYEYSTYNEGSVYDEKQTYEEEPEYNEEPVQVELTAYNMGPE